MGGRRVVDIIFTLIMRGQSEILQKYSHTTPLPRKTNETPPGATFPPYLA